jgi:hypothetical protein
MFIGVFIGFFFLNSLYYQLIIAIHGNERNNEAIELYSSLSMAFSSKINVAKQTAEHLACNAGIRWHIAVPSQPEPVRSGKNN